MYCFVILLFMYKASIGWRFGAFRSDARGKQILHQEKSVSRLEWISGIRSSGDRLIVDVLDRDGLQRTPPECSSIALEPDDQPWIEAVQRLRCRLGLYYWVCDLSLCLRANH